MGLESAHYINSIRDIIYLALCFPSFSLAAPTQGFSTSSRWPACLATVLIFALVSLSAIKLLFARQRRMNNLALPAGKRLDQSSDLSDLSADSARKVNENRKAGFLVGLFGSPSVEIHRQTREAALLDSGTPKSSFSDDFSGHVLTTCDTEKLDFPSYPLDGVLAEKPKWWTRRRNKSPTSLVGDVKASFVPPTEAVSGSSPSRNEEVHVPRQNIGAPGLLCPSGHLEQASVRLVEHQTRLQGPPSLSHGYYPEPVPRVLTPRGLTAAHLKPIVNPSLLDIPREPKQDSRSSLAYMMFGHPRRNAYSHLVKPSHQAHRKVSLSPALSVIHEVSQYSLPELPFVSDFDLVPPLPLIVAEGDGLPFPPSIVSLPLIHKLNDGGKEIHRPSPLRNRDNPPTLPFHFAFLPDISEGHSTDPSHAVVHNLGFHSPLESLATQCLGRDRSSLDPPPTMPEEHHETRELGEASVENHQNVLDFLHELAEEIKVWTRESHPSNPSETRFQRT